MIPIVAGCVVRENDKYLLVQEKQPSVYGQWNLPAGRVDVGESIEDAAVREVKEESGFDVELGERVSIEHVSSESLVLHAFKAEITGGTLKFDPAEQLDARWFTWQEIDTLDQNNQIRNGWATRVIRSLL